MTSFDNHSEFYNSVSDEEKAVDGKEVCPRCLGSGIDPEYGFGIYSACPECQE